MIQSGRGQRAGTKSNWMDLIQRGVREKRLNELEWEDRNKWRNK